MGILKNFLYYIKSQIENRKLLILLNWEKQIKRLGMSYILQHLQSEITAQKYIKKLEQITEHRLPVYLVIKAYFFTREP